ncbi:MAG: hypothetical protein VX257_10610, partial [Planctomycetota bacterium]|nr:hypothetical protein [Planctomycetota bacterium]
MSDRPVLLATLFSIPGHWSFVLSLLSQLPPGIDCGNGWEDNEAGTDFGPVPPRGAKRVAALV